MSTTNTSNTTNNNLGSGAAPASSGAGAGMVDALNGVKGAFAAVHGAGEKIRGEFNAGVDRAFNDVRFWLPLHSYQPLPFSAFQDRTSGLLAG